MTERLPRYSVLMSVYAGEKPRYLEEAILSILHQDYPTDDFVVVCDGPLGMELNKVLHTYSEQLHIIRLNENKGLGMALSIGLPACKYDLVARQDSDDISLPERCKKQAEFMQQHPQISLLSGKIEEYNLSMTEKTGERVLPVSHEELISFAKKRNPLNHPAVMLRKNKAIAAGGYRSDFPYFEDYDLWIRMLENGCCAANISDTLVHMRTSPDFYMRRGGRSYAGYMKNFRKWMKDSGYISTTDYIRIMSIHLPVCLLPNGIRKLIYCRLHGRKVRS